MNKRYAIQQYYVNQSPVLHVLRHGQKHALSRNALTELTGLDDRTVRREIETLRTKGIPICSNSQNKGYFLAETPEEVKHYVAETRHRAMKLLNLANKVAIGFFNRDQISF